MALAATGIKSSAFRTRLAQHLTLFASAQSLGNWTVVVSMPIIFSQAGGSDIDQPRPNFKYNWSATGPTVEGNGSYIIGQRDSLIPLVVGLSAAAAVAFLGLWLCLFRFLVFTRR